MDLPSYFTDFMAKIGPSDSERAEYQKRHSELREELHGDEGLSDIIVSTFLQGSYRRATLVRPKPGNHADVDVVVVTRLSQEDTTPDQAIRKFIPFLEKHYAGKYELRGRSVGIRLSKVDLDLVVTSAPSESQIGILQSEAVLSAETPEEVDDWRLVPSWVSLAHRVGEGSEALFKAAQEQEWKLEPLYIPDREVQDWVPTHPLEQIRWTHEKNRLTDGYYIQVVKAIKWWKSISNVLPKYPKGYPLEHVIGVCCPDGITSVAEGVTITLEEIASRYAGYAIARQTPVLPDHGVPENNVLKRVSGEDFARFHQQVSQAAKVARKARDAGSVDESATYWRNLFGDEFPQPPGDAGGDSRPDQPKGGFTPRKEVGVIGGGRFA